MNQEQAPSYLRKYIFLQNEICFKLQLFRNRESNALSMQELYRHDIDKILQN